MMSLTKAKAVAKSPEEYSTEELDDALTIIVEDDRLTEAQVTKLQAAIDPVLRARIDARRTLPRIWCDECHYWHNEVNECAYVTKAGA